MHKPKLQYSALPSTAVSKNLLSNSYRPLRTTTMKTGLGEFNNPMVTSFYGGADKREQTNTVPREEPILQKDSKSNDKNSWINTSDIESVIRKRIEADAQFSVERSFSTQRYFLGPQRICTEKILPLPFEIKQILQPAQIGEPIQKNHLVYGYLATLNAVYYIINKQLYIFSIDDLKKRENKPQDINSSQIIYKPAILRPNCRRIYQAQFPILHSHKMIPRQFNGKVLILQYPYEIELCCYLVDKRHQKLGINTDRTQDVNQRNFITLVNLNVRIPLQTAYAEFITVTSKGQLLYLDEKGQVVCFQFSKTDDTRLKRKTRQQTTSKKKDFISNNRGLLIKAKNYFFQKLSFCHSIFLSKKRNLSLIYDQKRNRIYTLTLYGDRNHMIQQIKKEIRVYEFITTNQKTELNCILSIPEEDFLMELGLDVKKTKLYLFSILKAELDYNQQTELIALLSNGSKFHLQFKQQKLRIIFNSISPDIEDLKIVNKERKRFFIEASNNFISKDQNSIIERCWNEKLKVQRTQKVDMKLKCFFNDRSLSVVLGRTDKQYSMYIMAKSLKNDDEIDVFPIYWKNQGIFHDIQKFPTENEIFMISGGLGQNSTSYIINRLQKIEHDKFSRSSYKTPHPTSLNGHQLLRQVYHSPQSFVYISNKFITNFTLLRPIDILHMMITTREETLCEMYLPAILGLEPYQICCMLLQLFCVKNGVYYNSKNYNNKITFFIQKLKQNTKRHQILGNSKSVLSKFSTSKHDFTENHHIFESKQEDQLIEVQTTDQEKNQELKVKYRRFFVTFSRYQLIQNPNVFQKIKLNFETSTFSSHLEDQIDKLNQEQKFQAKNCLLYISRVFYPFWRAKIVASEVSKSVIQTIKAKITQTQEVVQILKILCNDYWKHLHKFMQKITQIIQMCTQISMLPPNLTLEDAVSRQPSYFQPYIFMTLKRESKPQMLRYYAHKFPLFVSQYFETLIKIFTNVRAIVNVEEIKTILRRLDEYPDYFLDFLVKQKEFKDVSFLKIKGQSAQCKSILTIPNLPFQNLVQYLHSRVKSQSVKMPQKFMYLKEAKKRIDSYKNQQLKQKQVFSPYVLAKLQKQYDELFKCLKLQQECKYEIVKIAQELENENRQSQNEQNFGFFSKLMSKISLSSQSSSSTADEKYSKQKRLTLVTRSQNIQKIQSQNQQIFRKINSFALSRDDLKELIHHINSPKLKILHCTMFEGRGPSQIEKQHFKQNLFTSYRKIVQQGIKKYRIQTTIENSKFNFSKFIDYLRLEIREIYLFLNSTKTPLSFSPLYQGVKKELINIHSTLKFILQNTEQCIFSVGRMLVDLGFDRNMVIRQILYQSSLNQNFRTQEIQLGNISNQPLQLEKLVYDWYMAFDVAKRYKKQELDKLYTVTKDILEFKKQTLKQKIEFKQFLERGAQLLFSLINGNHENQISRGTIMGRVMNAFK